LNHTLATYVYNHCNICNIYLKRMKHTVTTCVHLLAAIQWTLVNAELDTCTKLDAWHIGRTSAVRSVSISRRHEVQQSIARRARRKRRMARGTGHIRREQRGTGAGGAGGTRRGWGTRGTKRRARGMEAGGPISSDWTDTQ
jgi:hypothetical protein